MSAFLLGTGFRADMGTCIRKLVLLKLIDACEDDGSRIFPAMATVAKAAQCSVRQVQREISAFVEGGLLMLVREGGKGRRSTNEYALDLDVLSAICRQGWDGYLAAKGDTVSPLAEGAKGDTGDMDRVTPETPKGDNGCHTTPPDPSLDPSQSAPAREREPEDRESEDPKRIDAEGWKLLKDWPGFAGMPKEPALKAWRALAPEDRAEAAAKFPHWLALLKAQGKSHTPAPATYFRERLFCEVAEPEAAPPSAYAPAFGPVWAVIRMRDIVTGQKQATPLKRWEEQAVSDGRLDRDMLERSNRANGGWPMVNAMHERAAMHGAGVGGFGAVEERLGKLTEFVQMGSAVWEDWRAEHERRGWPWIPDPGRMGGAYFPKGGPAGLDAFEAAVRGEESADDGGGREAAE